MKNNLWIIILITITCTIVYVVVRQAKLVNPGNMDNIPTSTPTPTATQYHFDKITDLKKELDSVNPKVEDSDFKE